MTNEDVMIVCYFCGMKLNEGKDPDGKMAYSVCDECCDECLEDNKKEEKIKEEQCLTG